MSLCCWRHVKLFARLCSFATIMLRLSSSFLLRPTYLRQGATSSLTSKMDDLMDEVLNNGGQNFTAATAASSSLASKNPWRVIDWEKEEKQVTSTPPSLVDVVVVRDRLVYFKRDDHLRLPGSQVSGNKARKMLTLNAMEDFPRCLVSYGGPQSNAMLALAAVVHLRNQGLLDDDPRRKRFVYYTKALPRFLRNQPSGNLFRALSLGMELRELSSQEYTNLFGGDFGGSADPPVGLAPPVSGDSVWVPQGGACGIATAGARLLAKEIVSFWSKHGAGRLCVCLPGGTCSTALFVHQEIRKLQQSAYKDLDIETVVIPCVGDAGYARRQMMSLNARTNFKVEDIPAILPPTPDDSYFGKQANAKKREYFRFGEPDAAILEVFRELKDESHVVLDLVYGAPSWAILLRHWRATSAESPMIAGREIMYVHSGGVEGINSQLLRYQYQGLVDLEDIQLPGRSSRG